MQQIDPTDQELAQRIKEGDQEAFRQLFDRYGEALYLEACRRTGCPHDARDLVQDTFLDVYLQQANFDIPASFAPLLFTILRNKIFSHFRKNIQQDKFKGVLQHFGSFTADVAPEDPLTLKQMQQVINTRVEEMPPRMRAIYRLSKMAGYTPRQVAELLSLSRQTVKNQLSAALRRIREGLDASGFIHLLFLNIHLIYALSTI